MKSLGVGLLVGLHLAVVPTVAKADTWSTLCGKPKELTDKQEVKAALQSNQKLLELAPTSKKAYDSALAHFNQAYLLFMVNQAAKSKEFAEKAIEMINKAALAEGFKSDLTGDLEALVFLTELEQPAGKPDPAFQRALKTLQRTHGLESKRIFDAFSGIRILDLCNPRVFLRAQTNKVAFLKRTMEGESKDDLYQQYGIRLRPAPGKTSTYLGPMMKAPKGSKVGEQVIATAL